MIDTGGRADLFVHGILQALVERLESSLHLGDHGL